MEAPPGQQVTAPPLAVVVGPTASGKSALAVRLAHRLAAQGTAARIINCDSAQVYADLQILSARPNEAEMEGIPHDLFGHVGADEDYNAARWADEAKAAVAVTHAAGAVPILAGGTGLYLRTLLEGIAPVPDIPEAIREAVRALPVAEAHAALAREDPAMAARLKPADTTRVARALEVVRASGHSIRHWQAQTTGGIGAQMRIVPMILLPDRAWLMERCDTRFTAMIAAGGEREAAALLDRAIVPQRPVMRAIGVPEIMAMLQGEMNREEAIAAAQLATRRYAKRQYTWFRNQPPADWPRHEDPLDTAGIDALAAAMAEQLSG